MNGTHSRTRKHTFLRCSSVLFSCNMHTRPNLTSYRKLEQSCPIRCHTFIVSCCLLFHAASPKLMLTDAWNFLCTQNFVLPLACIVDFIKCNLFQFYVHCRWHHPKRGPLLFMFSAWKKRIKKNRHAVICMKRGDVSNTNKHSRMTFKWMPRSDCDSE